MNNSKMKALIFDLDGVVVDTAEFHYLAWKRTGEKLGFKLPRELNEHLKGISRRDSLTKILGWADVVIPEIEFEDLMEEKNTYYLTLVAQMTPSDTLPGVAEFVRKSREAGYYTAIGSASKNALLILSKLDLSDAFDVIVDGNSVQSAKPEPEVFTRTADLLGVEYNQCVVFEDSEAGIEAAIAAGMVSIGIGSSPHLSRADRLLPGFQNISVEFINQLEI